MDNMLKRYSEALFGTEEGYLYNFLAAYFDQDIIVTNNSIKEYVENHNANEITKLIEAIEHFLKSAEYSDKEKRLFISELTSYECEPIESIEWLIGIKECLKSCI